MPSSSLNRWRDPLICLVFAGLLLGAPWVFSSSLSLTLLSQIGYLIIVCLSYNILLGQGGMLSFGQAVYTGLGSFMAVHAMNSAAQGGWPIPLVAIPLVGGLAGLGFAVLFGYVSTKKSGNTFAMITLGIGELVASMALMLPEFFGGEGGVSTDRVYGQPWLGFNFGPQIQVYYLIAAYCFVCTVLMYAFTRTPLGRLLNAVRDNAQRVEFIGYNAQRIRYLAFIIAGFFAGVGGGLAAINFEIVTAMDSISSVRSGGYLLFTFLGGAGAFFGPIIGAILLVFSSVLLSGLTKAWLLYLGLVFMLMVMYAPGGIAYLLQINWRVMQKGRWWPLLPHYLFLALGSAIALLGFSALVEMIYHIQLDAALGPDLSFMGSILVVDQPATWAGAVLILLTGLALLVLGKRAFSKRWNLIQEQIQATGDPA